MKAVIRSPDFEIQEINLILPEPFNLYPKDDILVEFIFYIGEEPVRVSLVGTNPYTKEPNG